jgi:hypothetical protein
MSRVVVMSHVVAMSRVVATTERSSHDGAKRRRDPRFCRTPEFLRFFG